MSPRIPSLLAAVLIPLLAAPAQALRVMSYNLLNYSGGRTTQFRLILEETQPDVLVVEEITGGVSSVNVFLADILDVVNPGEWVAGGYTDGPDTDQAVYVRSAKAVVLGHHTITTTLRDIDEWTIRPLPYASSAADLRVYAVHLKASQGTAEEQQRLAEVTTMRTRMETFAPGGNYLVTGDFNIYTSTEPAFQYMINPANGTAGVVQDPINRLGNWHINPAFADIHTQSPRVTQFGGGANGGMDDRFDLILTGPALLDGEAMDILPATYTAFGQDGMHFDGALNVAPFTVVTQVVAQALHDASDHLPVFADFQLPAVLVADASVDFGTVIVGGPGAATLDVGNGAPLPGDELDYSFAASPLFSAPAGSFQVAAGAPAAAHSLGMDTATAGARAGTLVVTTDDPDRPAWNVALAGTVLDHAQPSAAPGSLQLVASLDLGTVAPTDTAHAAALVHDLGFGPLVAALEVHGADLAGDPRFFLDGGFAPATAGASPASFDVAFDATGVADGVYNGTLVFHTRDLPGIPGGTDLDDVQFDLSVTVDAGMVGAPVLASISRTGFTTVRPNPFRDASEIRFGLVRSSRARVVVVDVTGRAVRTLADGEFPAGEHGITWDGRDAGGAIVAPGIYFVRLTSGDVAETRKLARIR